MSSLINELREKSTKADNIKNEIIAEIKHDFDKYLNSEQLESYLRRRIGDAEIKERKVFMCVEFWEYHDGCTTTNFHCGGHTWYNPAVKDGWESRTYNGIELNAINEEVCDYLCQRLTSRMNEMGFHVVSKDKQRSRFGYSDVHFYFGW